MDRGSTIQKSDYNFILIYLKSLKYVGQKMTKIWSYKHENTRNSSSVVEKNGP